MRLRLPSRISIRLLLFNVLLVLLPVAGFLYLDVYEDQLLRDQERCHGPAGTAARGGPGRPGRGERAGAERLLRRLEGRTESRLRIFGRGRRPPRRLEPSRSPEAPTEQTPWPVRVRVSVPAGQARDNLLYRGAAGLYRL